MKIDAEMFAATKQDQYAKNAADIGLSEADRQKIYKKAESKGLLPFHMYSVLDIRVIQTPQNKQATLVRLQNPWADAPEWNGRCSDKDDSFWT